MRWKEAELRRIHRERHPLPDSAAEAHVRREVEIECGARSDAWPAEEHVIVPYVAAVVPAIDDAQVTLRVLNIERTFWEKATILHAEAHREAAKAMPVRYARHYADLAALADHASAARAVAGDALRERVVAHKRVFFPVVWVRYETAVAGTFRLVPDDYRLGPLETDYRAMREMYFGEPRPWPDIVARLRAVGIRDQPALNGGSIQGQRRCTGACRDFKPAMW